MLIVDLIDKLFRLASNGGVDLTSHYLRSLRALTGLDLAVG